MVASEMSSNRDSIGHKETHYCTVETYHNANINFKEGDSKAEKHQADIITNEAPFFAFLTSQMI